MMTGSSMCGTAALGFLALRSGALRVSLVLLASRERKDRRGYVANRGRRGLVVRRVRRARRGLLVLRVSRGLLVLVVSRVLLVLVVFQVRRGRRGLVA